MTNLDMVRHICRMDNIGYVEECQGEEKRVSKNDSPCVNLSYSFKPQYWVQYHVKNSIWGIKGLTEYIVIQKPVGEDCMCFIFDLGGAFLVSGGFGNDDMIDIDYEKTSGDKIVCKDCEVVSFEVVGYKDIDKMLGNTEWRQLDE